jgi:hypothetical protein
VAKYPQVRVLQRPFDHFAEQLNFGLSHVRTEWVLTMDADYVVSDALGVELQTKLPTLDKDGYRIRFRYCIAGMPLRGSIYPDRIALFRTSRGHFEQDGHAQRLVLDGEVGSLRGVIYHDDRKPLSTFLKNQNWYETLEAEKLSTARDHELTILDKARRTRWLAPLLVVGYCLFWKGLIFEGKKGLFYTLQRAYTELLLSIMLLDRDLTQKGLQSELPTGKSPENLLHSSETAVRPVA